MAALYRVRRGRKELLDLLEHRGLPGQRVPPEPRAHKVPLGLKEHKGLPGHKGLLGLLGLLGMMVLTRTTTL
tara:strand:+ start:296 stop:511 length:216 start_codon:yes stop_codon:yes gene_type:complete